MSVRYVFVVVLGDIGRSPRMQYHALSLSEIPNMSVTLVGLEGEQPLDSVKRRVIIRAIPDYEAVRRLPWVLRAPLRACRNAIRLFIALVRDGRAEMILVQNPPAIPTLAVCVVASWWTGAALVIDWHNLGFKMLEANGGRLQKALARIARVYEKYVAKLADRHICVTQALSEWLQAKFALGACPPVVVYDRPHVEFRRLSPEDRVEFLSRLGRKGTLPRDVCSDLVKRRAALIVTSTSWTPDEDFTMLLNALHHYAQQVDPAVHPALVVVVTGKGPLRATFEPLMIEMDSSTNGLVKVMPAWLESGDYPLFLGCADLGVCMHTSTSGLDLPMKVVDMFGAALPTLAVSFDCLPELVKDGVNGKIFVDSADMASKLLSLLKGFPNASGELNLMRENLDRGFEDWQSNWTRTAQPVFTCAMDTGKNRVRFRGIVSILAALVGLAQLFSLWWTSENTSLTG